VGETRCELMAMMVYYRTKIKKEAFRQIITTAAKLDWLVETGLEPIFHLKTLILILLYLYSASKLYFPLLLFSGALKKF
jgi:hypothetical protein